MRKSQSASPIPRPGEGKRGEEGYLGYLLRQASVANRARMDRALAEFGVTTPQFALLTMIAAYPGVSNAELARLSLLTPQTVSAVVATLEHRGLLTRRPHAVHGRILHLDVTPAGRALLARCRQRVQEIERQLAEGLSPAEERAIRRWLVRVAMEAGEGGEGGDRDGA